MGTSFIDSVYNSLVLEQCKLLFIYCHQTSSAQPGFSLTKDLL